MWLFGSTSVLALLATVSQNVTLNSEAFTGPSSSWSWNTPGFDDAETAFTQTTGATPTGSSGPDGGSNPADRQTDAANSYAYAEATNNAGPFSIESPEFDAGAGTLDLRFDLHMRFGSEGGIGDGELKVQGWNGSAWSDIGNAITGSQQTAASSPYVPSSNFDTYTSSGFSNVDFKFRLLFTKGANPFDGNYDCAIDNARVNGPPDAAVTQPPTPSNNVRAEAFNQGLRRLHVSPTSTPPVDGATPTLSFTSLQSALNALQQGDALTIGAGDYFGTFSRSGIAGTAQNPVLIAEEVLGTVRILNVKQDAFEGNQSWAGPFSGDRYSANIGDTYMGVHDGDFMPKYSSTGVLDAGSVNGQNKPVQGCAVVGSTVHVRLKGGVNPNGESILLTAGASQDVVSFSNCDFVIWDGCTIEGGGEQAGIAFDQNSASPVVRHVTTNTSRFLCSVPSNAIVERCNYILADETKGGKAWMRECVSLNGGDRAPFFDIIKGDLADGGNALFEGGIAVGAGGFNSGAVHQNCEFRFNRHIGVFDGERFGEFRNSVTHDNVYDEMGDDGIQFEDDRNNNHGDGNVAYFCRFRNPHGPVISHQNDGVGEHTVVRCLTEIDEPAIFRPEFLIKTIRTATGSTIHHLFNYYERFGSPNGALWYPFSTPQAGGQTTGGDAITNFRGNIVNFDGASVQFNSGGVPPSRADNIYAGSAGNLSGYRGGGDVDAGDNESDLLLNADFTPQPGSPALGRNVSIPGGVFDPLSGLAGSDDDAGPFPDGFDPGANWPRSFEREDDTSVLPTRWVDQS